MPVLALIVCSSWGIYFEGKDEISPHFFAILYENFRVKIFWVKIPYDTANKYYYSSICH